MGQNETRDYERHHEQSAVMPAGAEELFAYLDDHANLSSHMDRPSWMMGGGSMETSVDEGHGKETGSHIRMEGKAFGFALSLDEVVTVREPHILFGGYYARWCVRQMVNGARDRFQKRT